MSELLMSPARGQVWQHRWMPDRFIGVIEVQRDGRVRFAAVQVSPDGHVTRDVRCSQPYLETAAGLRRVFTLTDYQFRRGQWAGGLPPREP